LITGARKKKAKPKMIMIPRSRFCVFITVEIPFNFLMSLTC